MTVPRISPEARSAALYLHGTKPPPPPKSLDAASAKLWKEIAASKPNDWWQPGNLQLLRRYVKTATTAERWEKELDQLKPGSPQASAVVKEMVSLNHSMGSLAVKLRLSTQNMIERHSGLITEKGPGIGRSRLLGGHTVGDGWDDGLLGVCRDDTAAYARAFPNGPSRSKRVRQ
jgi:hypothetical protein